MSTQCVWNGHCFTEMSEQMAQECVAQSKGQIVTPHMDAYSLKTAEEFEQDRELKQSEEQKAKPAKTGYLTRELKSSDTGEPVRKPRRGRPPKSASKTK